MNKPTIAIAGATGFIGRSLCRYLEEHFSVIGLSRNPPKETNSNLIKWRKADLFSVSSTTNSLFEVDVAIYLVHSMAPVSRLFQGDFSDTDLLLADNFARACRYNKVKQIIYLGGIIPNTKLLSHHLKSRKEVEGVLKSSGCPITILRAGMIVGAGGNSFTILKNLVLNFPIIFLPKWSSNITKTIYIGDLLKIIKNSILNTQLISKTLNVVTSENLDYRGLIETIIHFMSKKRLLIPLPINFNKSAKYCIKLFGKSSIELVSPLVDSLVCNFININPSPEIKQMIKICTFQKMLLKVEKWYNINNSLQATSTRKFSFNQNTVRSVQRLPSFPSKNSLWLAKEYLRWLPICFQLLLHVDTKNGHYCQFHIPILPFPLLILQHDRCPFDDDRQKFLIKGGILSKTTDTGWLEFRQIDNKLYTIAAIHNYIPSLPWPIYKLTQAKIHILVMRLFAKHLKNTISPTKRGQLVR